MSCPDCNPFDGVCAACRRDLDNPAARAAHVAALPTPTELRVKAGALDPYLRGHDRGRLRERADVLEYLHDLVADTDADGQGGPFNEFLAQILATTANEIAGGVHLDRDDDGAGGGS